VLSGICKENYCLWKVVPTLIYLSLCCHDGKMLLKFPNMFLSFLSLIFFRGLLFHLSRNIGHPPNSRF
jgi:hypothetical protein